MCRCHAITGKSHSLDFCKAEKTPCLNKPVMFYRSQPISTPLVGSRCVQDEHCGDIWPKSMPCTGDPIRGRKARMYNGHICRSFSDICLIRSCFMFMYLSFFQALGQCLSRWQTHYLGQLYYKQGRFCFFIFHVMFVTTSTNWTVC